MKKIAVVIGLIACGSTFSIPVPNSARIFWQDIRTGNELQQKITKEQSLKRRTLSLNEERLKEELTGGNSKLSSRSVQSEVQQVEIDLPLPDGGFVRVRAIESPILSSDVAEQYPEIKTWRVQGVDDSAISGRIDFTSKGFHGMLTMPDGDSVYIDPDKSDATNLYHSLSKRTNISHFKTDFNCKLNGDHSLHKHGQKRLLAKKLAQTPALDLITYRLALAGTGEYTASQGGSSASAYSSMVTTINRVNEIYQRDLGVKLEIVSTESLAYLSASTDPYTNSSAGSLVSENIQNINNTFGVANYDLGHVFAQGPLGGLAYVGAACYNDYKAGGATGISSPQGEIFSIEYVAHEMGHQLGATHTFNSQTGSCSGSNRTLETAVEPGSGSTIMSYSGLCGSDNLQNHSDAMFHWASIDQINSYTRTEYGNSCGTQTSTGNQNPTANAGADGVIPLTTPFILDGSATGGSTYSWDQKDTGTASTVNVDTGNNAIIRAILPAASPDRYIPRLSDLFAGSSTIGEKLPQTVRDVNFAFVVRDGNGGVATDFKKISVKDTGGTFRVLSHASPETISTGQSINVAWNVGGTTNAPVSCSKVDIQLVRVNGVKNTLLLNTDNDGNEQFVVASSTPTMTNARIMVACSSQPFFHISSGDITVQQGSGGTTDTIPPVIMVTGSKTLSITQGSSYTDAGATAEDNIDGAVSVASSGTVNTSVAGTYTITYTATDSSNNTATAIRTVNVTAVETVDTTPPVITIIGSINVGVPEGATYTDAGATATDDIDGVVSITPSGTVNTSVAGTYTITYTATDSSDNVATAVRTVNVTASGDIIPPVITLNGASLVEVIQGASYTDAGATATDNVDSVVSVSSTGAVNTAVIGTYFINFTASDAAGNKEKKVRTVKVVEKIIPDTQAPIITLNGSNSISIAKDTKYIEAGATAVDDRDGVVNVVISGTVSLSKVGIYTITYTAKDAAGNTSAITRKVEVTLAPDTTAPVITLTGESTIILEVGQDFTDPGVAAFDDRDGIVSVVVTGTVDVNKAGTYTLIYTATDAAGNTFVEERTVIIKDNDGSKEEASSGGSGGGSITYLLLPMTLIGLRRRVIKLRKD